jgi:hypothetical protein
MNKTSDKNVLSWGTGRYAIQSSRLCIAMMAILVWAGLLEPIPALAQNCEYWVAPNGNDANPGTFNSPWATLAHASETIPDANCTVWFEDGLYVGENHLNRRFETPTAFKAANEYRAVFESAGITLDVDGAKNVIVEGFEIRQSGPGAIGAVVMVDRSDNLWAEYVTLRNNIIHDSYDNDLIKIHNGTRFATIEGNIFFNQGTTEQHIDANSVTDVVIEGNIFFNDFAGSGRQDTNMTKHFIMIKDSNDNTDGLQGAERISVRRNIFLNWQGGAENFIKTGNDGKPYHEAKDVRIENNLMVGNAGNLMTAALGVRGAKNVTFANNTVVGNLPAKAFAFRADITGSNPLNENIAFYNNIWSDPTGTMGSDLSGSASNKFAAGSATQTTNLILRNNLYWNGSQPIPNGEPVSPLNHDPARVVADPLLTSNHGSATLPHWNGSSFPSGNRSIQQEFVRLVEEYGKIPAQSAAIGKADPAFAPATDILGRARTAAPSLGAYEVSGPSTGGTNQAPSVNAGADQTITLPASATLDGTVTDDGQPNPPGAINTTWSQVSGPGTVTFANASAADTTASFSTPGAYTLRLSANDGAATSSDDLSVTVNPATNLPLATSDVIYLSSTTNGSVPGAGSFADEDILAFNPNDNSWSLYFDGSDVGLGGSGMDVNAFTVLPNGEILLSVIAPISLPGVGSVDDSDIVKFVPTSLGSTTAGTYSIYFDGSDVGLTTDSEDVDAIAITADNRLVISTEGNYSVSGLSTGADEDLLLFNSSDLGSNTRGTWAFHFDGSDADLTSSEDITGAWIAANGDIYLTAGGNFTVGSVSGQASDIFRCTPSSFGANTACAFAFFWDGGAQNFGTAVIDGLAFGTPQTSARSADVTPKDEGIVQDETIDSYDTLFDDLNIEGLDNEGAQEQILLPLIQQ